jgi:hypothetical protein
MIYKVKLVVGFRRDQEHSIDANESHKAYYLFLNPEKRGIFNNGLAIVGSQIQEIIPDFQGTMGWNPTHVLDNDDMTEIRNKGVDRKLRHILSQAKEIATKGDMQLLGKPLSEVIKPEELENRSGLKSMKELLDK